MKKRLIKRVTETESTNTLALELIRHGAAVGTVVVAEAQTEGRGRLNRAWFSPAEAGLYFSVILRPNLNISELPRITLAAGVAVCDAVKDVCSIILDLKWPNDLLLAGKKVGGILCETEPATGGQFPAQPFVILGIGLNVLTPEALFPPNVRELATSLLAHSGKKFEKEDLLLAVLDEIEIAVSTLEMNRFDMLIDQWRRRDGLLGKTLSWLNPSGDIVSGEALGIGDDGQYRIRDVKGEIHLVMSGDISLVNG